MLRLLLLICVLVGLAMVADHTRSVTARLGDPSDIPVVVQVPMTGLADCIFFDADFPCDGDDYFSYLEIQTGSDPYDPNSTPEYALLDEQSGLNTCNDRTDNDLDGVRDKRDAGCRLTCKDFGVKERCTDRDHDGWLHYVEVQHGSDPTSRLSTPETRAVADSCEDGVDNDLDGYTDILDCNRGGCVDFDETPPCKPF